MPSRHHRRSNGGWQSSAPFGCPGGAATSLCGVGGFTADNYWSSSQNDASNAWNQNFDNGSQNTDNKDNDNHVRPVRGFRYGTDVQAERITAQAG
jgi:hypothetical protein